MACIHPYRNFDAKADAQILHEAVKGMGCDKDVIIDILTHRTVKQRKEIEVSYKAQYGGDLKERLKKELHGDLEHAVLWSFLTPAEINATALNKAMKGMGTDESMLIDIICTANNLEMEKIKEAFEEITGKSLEDEIRSETSGDFRRVLIAILQGSRSVDFDEAQARVDAQEIFDAGEDKLGTDESTFVRIICSSSFKQIRAINECYQELTGHDLITAIGKETSGDFKKALTRVVQIAINKAGTIAEMLYKSMKGAGTDDTNLIRIILCYAESDLGKIRAWFDGNYEKSLAEMITGDTSGDYRKFLLSIVE
nr:annexin [Hymenolepis microstoma]